MENKEKSNNIPLIIVTILLIIVTLALVTMLILGINYNNKQEQLISELNGKLEEQKSSELEEFIEMLQGEPEEYLVMVGLSTDKKLPTFTNINEAEPEWIWKNVRDCLEYMAKESFNYEDIIDYAKVIYGDNFNLKLPKEGGYGFVYDSKTNQYGIDELVDDIENENIYFTIKNIDKDKSQAIVEIVEYMIKDEYDEEDKETLLLYDKDGNLVKSYEIDSNNDDDYMEKWEEIEKDSENMKPSKKIKLELSEKQVYHITSISNI